ncbi:MAG: Gfo/Idh/MocA family oxidoreductase [Thermomicrobiales bacterium]
MAQDTRDRSPIVRIGIVGLGQGQSHLAAFHALDGVEVVAVADLNPDLRDRVAREHHVPRHYETIDALLDDKAIEGVVIATPDHVHGAHAIQALEAGKHVLSEIPMATTIEECRRIIDLTDRTGLKYQMGNQVRYAHCLQDVQRLLQAGDLGTPFYGEGEYLHALSEHIWRREAHHWRVTGPVPQTTLLGGGPHALDTLRWLMGVRFARVSAFHSAHQTEWGTTHTTVAIYQATNGATAKITTSYAMVRPYCLYFSVYGSEGTFERTRLQGEPGGETTNYLYHSRLSGTERMIPVTLPNWTNPLLARQASTLGHGTMEYEQARDFIAAIRHDTEPVIGPREAAASIIPLICGLTIADQGGGMMEIPDLG